MECFIADGGKTGRGGDAIKGSWKILRSELPVVLSLGGRITVQLWGGLKEGMCILSMSVMCIYKQVGLYMCVCVCADVLGVRQKAEVGVNIGVRPLEYNNNPEISLPVALRDMLQWPKPHFGFTLDTHTIFCTVCVEDTEPCWKIATQYFSTWWRVCSWLTSKRPA